MVPRNARPEELFVAAMFQGRPAKNQVDVVQQKSQGVSFFLFDCFTFPLALWFWQILLSVLGNIQALTIPPLYLVENTSENKEEKEKHLMFLSETLGHQEKFTKAVKDFSWEKFPKASPAGAPDHRQSPRCAPSVQVELETSNFQDI